MTTDVTEPTDGFADGLAVRAAQVQTDEQRVELANALLRSLAELEFELDSTTHAAKRDVAAVAARWERATAGLVQQRARLTAILQGVISLIWFPSKRKSRQLEAGRVGVRTKPMRLVVEEPQKVVEWATQQGHAMTLLREKHIVEPLHSGLVQYLEEAGEIPPGCRVEPASEVYVIEPDLSGVMALPPDAPPRPALGVAPEAPRD